MSDFDRLCKEFEKMDPLTYSAVIKEKSVGILTALSAITKNGMDGMTIYADFILCSIAADGKLSKEEFSVLQPSLCLLMGKDVTYEDARSMFKELGLDRSKDYKEVMDLMVDILGLVSQELKDDIITVCMMICAIDGRISFREKRWIRRLIE